MNNRTVKIIIIIMIMAASCQFISYFFTNITISKYKDILYSEIKYYQELNEIETEKIKEIDKIIEKYNK